MDDDDRICHQGRTQQIIKHGAHNERKTKCKDI